MLGGSPYYVLAGVAITLSAILIARRNWSGVWVYAAFWLATLLWALWESGLDGWALAPRMTMPTALGLWMLTPWFRRGMRVARPLPGGRILWPALATVLVAWIGFLFWIERTQAPSDTDIAPVATAHATAGVWLARTSGVKGKGENVRVGRGG